MLARRYTFSLVVAVCAMFSGLFVSPTLRVQGNVVSAGQRTPMDRSPWESDVPSDGNCVRGRTECRWGGDCVKRRNKCLNCIQDYKWSDEMNTCYRCGDGESLKRDPSGKFICQ